MKATRFLSIDFPHLDRETAIAELANRLREAAYQWEDGQIVGVRDPHLLALSIELRIALYRLVEKEKRATERRRKLLPRAAAAKPAGDERSPPR
jgi:hypothetical protein